MRTGHSPAPQLTSLSARNDERQALSRIVRLGGCLVADGLRRQAVAREGGGCHGEVVL